MGHAAGPLSCSRNISMEPDTVAGRDCSKKRKKKNKKELFTSAGWKENTTYWTELFHYSECAHSVAHEGCCRLSFICVFFFIFVWGKNWPSGDDGSFFQWTAAAVLQPRHKSRDPPRGQLASSLLSQPLFSAKHHWSAAAVFSQSSGSDWAEEEEE